ncbi:MAG TPA: hypothetical protein VMZ91_08680 [Candidatus Paceibacterota bacterium]|nr:hypothetical protein [Candidatus Paceibacterota bacterium]
MEEKKDVRFIAFLDEYDNKVEGMFEVILDNGICVKFKTKENIVTIPYSRLLKMKESSEHDAMD